jgi:TolB-like protein/Tfp pilus assembly protein PilF
MKNYSAAPQTIRFGAFELDVNAGELRKRGVLIRLQEQPLRILEILLANPGQLVTREELRGALWPTNTFVDFDHGLNRAINKLREALGDSADSPRLVETLAKRGYRFIGDLTRPSRRIDSLAVLPLDNISRDPEQEFFADGMTEALITTLAKISGLQVASRTSIMRYKGVRDKSLIEIATELGVDGIVEGTVSRFADRVRISAQLIDASTDRHVWAESYDRDARDIFALQTEVACTIVKMIEIRVTPQEQARLSSRREVKPEVYEAYLKGRYFWNRRTLEGMSKGIEYFQIAIDEDPSYAPAYAGLADSAARLGWYGYVTPDNGCGRAKRAALQAIQLDATLADAHAAFAFGVVHYDYTFDEATAESRLAVELDPRSTTAAQTLAISLMASGRADEAVDEIMRAVRLDPLSLALQWNAGVFCYLARQYERAVAESRKCFELDPSFPQAWSTLVLVLTKQGPDETVITDFEHIVEASPGNQYLLGILGHYHASVGRRDYAQWILDKMQDKSAHTWVCAFWPAVINAGLGNMDEAFRCLETAYAEHASWLAYAKVAPFMDDFRADARFDRLLQRLNCDRPQVRLNK